MAHSLNQIVKSLSLCHEKSYFFNMVQPINLLFCKMTEIIEQNVFNRAEFLLRSKFSFFLARSTFSADDVTHIKSINPI